MILVFNCLKVFLARIIDVSLGVIRTVMLVKDNIKLAVIIAFFEVFIWLIIAREALVDANIFIMIFYSLGYAVGTLVGAKLSKKYSKGTSTIQVISYKFTEENIEKIKDKGYGISSIKMENRKKFIIIEVNTKEVDKLLRLIRRIDKDAFITVSDTKLVLNGFIK